MSTFSDAIMQGMVANLDPMNGVVQDYAKEQLSAVKKQNIRGKLDLMDELGKRITDAQANDLDGRVIESYQRILKEVSS